VTYISAAKPQTTDELIYQRKLELMHIQPGPNAYGEFLDFLFGHPTESMFIAKQAQQEILGASYTGPSTSEDAAFIIFSVFDGLELLDFKSEQRTTPVPPP
jgi:hypothetical protein